MRSSVLLDAIDEYDSRHDKFNNANEPLYEVTANNET